MTEKIVDFSNFSNTLNQGKNLISNEVPCNINKEAEAETSAYNNSDWSKPDNNESMLVSLYQDDRICTTVRSNPMSKSYFQAIRSEKLDYLLANDPNAFLLLSFIAKNAIRSKDLNSGLEPGDTYIGEKETPKKCGLTPKKFRAAKIRLIKQGLIEEVYNPLWNKQSEKGRTTPRTDPELKKTQKRAIKKATKSCIVNLCSSDIYDINIINEGDLKGDLTSKKGRPKGDLKGDISISIKEDKNKNKKDKKKKEPYVPKHKDATSLLEYFYSSLIFSFPEYAKKKLDKSEKQLKSADELLKIYSYDDLKICTKYSHSNAWWRKAIHKLSNLENNIIKIKIQCIPNTNENKKNDNETNNNDKKYKFEKISFAEGDEK